VAKISLKSAIVIYDLPSSSAYDIPCRVAKNQVGTEYGCTVTQLPGLDATMSLYESKYSTCLFLSPATFSTGECYLLHLRNMSKLLETRISH
jgi:hypothetical protein